MPKGALISLLSAALIALTACGAPQESLLEPTRTPGAIVTRPAPTPSPTSALRPAATPRPQTARPNRAIQPETLERLQPIYTLADPFVYHAYTAAEDVIGLFGTSTFELRDRQTLAVITRTEASAPDPILWYALSLDARTGAILRPQGTLELYDVRSGARRRVLDVPEPNPALQSDIALSADGQTLVLLAGGALYEVATNRGGAVSLDQRLPEKTEAVLFSADASHLAAAQPDGDIVILFPLSERSPITLSGVLSETATHMAFNATGTRFSATDGDTLVIWALEEGRARVVRRFDALGTQVLTFLDAGGRYMAVVQGDEAYLYDLVKDEPVGTLQVAEGVQISSILFDPDGERVHAVSASVIASFRISDQDLLELELRPPLMRPVFVPQSNLLLTYGGLTPAPSVAAVDPSGGDIVGVLPYRSIVRRLSLGNAGRAFAVQTQEGEIVVRSLEDGSVRARVAASERQTPRALLCLSNDERRVVFFDAGRVRLYNVERDRDASSIPMPREVNALSSCDNEQNWFAVNSGNALQVLDLAGASQFSVTLTLERDERVRTLALDRATRRVAALTDNRVLVWDISTGDERAAERLDRTALLIRFSPTGDFLVIQLDGGLQVLEIGNAALRSLRFPAGSVLGFDFLPDAPILVSAAMIPSEDTASRPGASRRFIRGELAFWDLSSGRALRRIETDSPLWEVAVDPVGTRIAVGDISNRLTLWGLP